MKKTTSRTREYRWLRRFIKQWCSKFIKRQKRWCAAENEMIKGMYEEMEILGEEITAKLIAGEIRGKR